MQAKFCHALRRSRLHNMTQLSPQGAFNKRKVYGNQLDKLLLNKSYDRFEKIVKGKQSQRGLGAYTLCARCNNNQINRYYPLHT